MRGALCLATLAVLGVGVVSANTAPLADAGLDQEVLRGTTVYLDAGGSTDPDGTITKYEWEITTPNGTVTRPACPRCDLTQFVPNQTGTYEVTVAVTDDDGATRRDTLYVTVEAVDPPTVRLSGPETMAPGETGSYQAQARAGNFSLSRMIWRVDGRQLARGSVSGQTATASAEMSLSPGTHTVRVSVVDRRGFRSADSMRVGVSGTVGGGAPPEPPDSDPGGSNDSGDDGGSDDDDDQITTEPPGETPTPPGDDPTPTPPEETPTRPPGETRDELGGGSDDIITFDAESGTWDVDQELASRMDATVEVGDATVTTEKLAKPDTYDEVVNVFEKRGASEEEMIEAAAEGRNRCQYDQCGLGTVDNSPGQVEYEGSYPEDSDDGETESEDIDGGIYDFDGSSNNRGSSGTDSGSEKSANRDSSEDETTESSDPNDGGSSSDGSTGSDPDPNEVLNDAQEVGNQVSEGLSNTPVGDITPLGDDEDE